jgi:uncharacterized protein (TIGR02453 family)
MISTSTLQFLKDLKKHNNKEWFDANRDRYARAKTDFENMVAAMIQKLGSFDSSIAHLQAKDCMFRINRDVRFSKNKAPYKTNMAMYVSKHGKKAMDCAGYYLHVEPGASFVAAGIWMPMAPELKKVRQEIDYNFDEFQKLVKQKSFKNLFPDLDRSQGAVLSRPPKGYEADNPAIEYLKLKSFIVTTPLADDVLTGKPMLPTVSAAFKTAFPLVQFINRALEE